MDTVHTETIDGITYTLAIAQDDIDVRGNAMASGDDNLDKEVEDDILERLNNGETWAWAYARVTASVEIDGETFEGSDSLGACSYRDTAEFIVENGHCYYADMKSEAKQALIQAIQKAINRGTVAKGALEQFKS